MRRFLTLTLAASLLALLLADPAEAGRRRHRGCRGGNPCCQADGSCPGGSGGPAYGQRAADYGPPPPAPGGTAGYYGAAPAPAAGPAPTLTEGQLVYIKTDTGWTPIGTIHGGQVHLRGAETLRQVPTIGP